MNDNYLVLFIGGFIASLLLIFGQNDENIQGISIVIAIITLLFIVPELWGRYVLHRPLNQIEIKPEPVEDESTPKEPFDWGCLFELVKGLFVIIGFGIVGWFLTTLDVKALLILILIVIISNSMNNNQS